MNGTLPANYTQIKTTKKLFFKPKGTISLKTFKPWNTTCIVLVCL